MATAIATTISRRSWMSRLLMAAVAPMVGATLASPVQADKKKKKKPSIKERAEMFRSGCVGDGGTATVEKRPGGTTVTCTGGDLSGDWSCTVSSKTERCHANLTNSPTTHAGGGGAVPPSNGNENPTHGGGNNAGGGAHVPPSGGVDPTGGGSGPVLE